VNWPDCRTRADDDFAIGLLDAWAVVSDVLTFYQERIANESYLRIATAERRSVLETGPAHRLRTQSGPSRPRPNLLSPLRTHRPRASLPLQAQAMLPRQGRGSSWDQGPEHS